jgi:hypothetical protein
MHKVYIKTIQASWDYNDWKPIKDSTFLNG